MNDRTQAAGPRVALCIPLGVLATLVVAWLAMLMSGDPSQAAGTLGAGIAATAAAGGRRRSCRPHRRGRSLVQ
jgi:hypothetical protein